MLEVAHGQVAVKDSVSAPRPVSGSQLRDAFLHDTSALTLGLLRMHGTSLWLGPLELLRFGKASVSRSAVEWTIEGGLLSRAPGGKLRIEAAGGRLVTSLDGYRPLLPSPLYVVTQLPVHHVFTRLQLLRVRGREPASGVVARSSDRRRSAAVDLAFCAILARLAGRRRPRLKVFLGVAAAYHVTCWTISGRTLGGLVMRQRLVSIDGSRPSFGQAVVRLLALPVAWVHNRPDQDEIACTEVVVD
ncbi:MAG: RDD family protein [Candidatus Dormiibacterota bacterium]